MAANQSPFAPADRYPAQGIPPPCGGKFVVSDDDDSDPVAIRHRRCRRSGQFKRVRPSDPTPMLFSMSN
jgi:hypothetical protein